MLKFTTSSPSTIELCEHALKLSPHGGYIVLRGQPIKVVAIDYKLNGPAVVAVVTCTHALEVPS
jgi:hypothetical protein